MSDEALAQYLLDQVMAAVWELIIPSCPYFIPAYVKPNCKQEYKIGYVTINHQILQQSNNYQDIEILYQEYLALTRMVIIE